MDRLRFGWWLPVFLMIVAAMACSLPASGPSVPTLPPVSPGTRVPTLPPPTSTFTPTATFTPTDTPPPTDTPLPTDTPTVTPTNAPPPPPPPTATPASTGPLQPVGAGWHLEGDPVFDAERNVAVHPIHIDVTGGNGVYTYYREGEQLPGPSFQMEWVVCTLAGTNIRVESGDGQSLEFTIGFHAFCPTPIGCNNCTPWSP